MRNTLMIFTALGLLMTSIGTASAVMPRGDCGCTGEPPICDPDKDLVPSDLARVDIGRSLILAKSGTYITDKDGHVWYCEKGECVLTGIKTAV